MNSNNSNNNDNFPPVSGGGIGPPDGGGGMDPPDGGGGMGPPLDFGPIPISSIQRNLASFYIHCLSSRLFREEFLNLMHCRRHQRVGVITQTLGLQGSQTQAQLYHLEEGKFTKA
ncbi:unnamed protein product [Rotaria sp. Silwood1]|nr:unnamed protein product [Rotaria sp. Silwood1]CAF1571060.1 unnamed protein product [Rotaria sp. Silwood1]CAF1575780.1 unnamed protein product [Rotaria sp. Silwood1]CAF3665138.1 unnamed protein product [Rotaria sp. Silwood1]CAF3692859.1 unnamed protein product [Rotaria sp. Silwood1]